MSGLGRFRPLPRRECPGQFSDQSWTFFVVAREQAPVRVKFLEKPGSQTSVDQGDDRVATRLGDQIPKFGEELELFSSAEVVLRKSLKESAGALMVRFVGMFGAESETECHDGRRGFQNFVDDARVRRIREGEQMLDDIQAGLFHGIDPGAPGLDLGEAQLLQFFQGLTDRASVNLEALGQVALRGQALARAVAAAEDIVAQFGRDLFAMRRCFHGDGGAFKWGMLGLNPEAAEIGGASPWAPLDRPIWTYQYGQTNLVGPNLPEWGEGASPGVHSAFGGARLG